MNRAAIGVSLLATVMGFGLIPGCGDDGESPGDASARVLLSTEGERLNAYDLTHGWRKQAVVTGGEDEHAGGLSLNGQICFDPHGSRLFVAANDAGQPAIAPGWAVMRLHGDRVGELSVTAAGMLSPTYQADRDTYGASSAGPASRESFAA
jgi:hypothetical protein